MPTGDAADRSFLEQSERGNPDTDLDSAANSWPGSADRSWSEGNLVTRVPHG